jgi:hypothetical protein
MTRKKNRNPKSQTCLRGRLKLKKLRHLKRWSLKINLLNLAIQSQMGQMTRKTID